MAEKTRDFFRSLPRLPCEVPQLLHRGEMFLDYLIGAFLLMWIKDSHKDTKTRSFLYIVFFSAFEPSWQHVL
jgi:hypothetical protein